MTVYVDEFRVWAPTNIRCFRNGSSHLTADTVAELHEFAKSIGLAPEWYQPLSSPHYDLTRSKRALALTSGARFVPAKEQALRRLAARRAP